MAPAAYQGCAGLMLAFMKGTRLVVETNLTGGNHECQAQTDHQLKQMIDQHKIYCRVIRLKI
jgi:hypothetical protein